MTTHAAWDLQQAVFDALVADPDLVTLLGGTFVYDAVPPNTDAPYVHLSDVTARDWSTATEAGTEVAFTVTAWSREAGRREALAIADRVQAALHDSPLTLAAHNLVNLRHLATETASTLIRGGRRARARFRAVLEPV